MGWDRCDHHNHEAKMYLGKGYHLNRGKSNQKIGIVSFNFLIGLKKKLVTGEAHLVPMGMS
jgi:hypothetical protein